MFFDVYDFLPFDVAKIEQSYQMLCYRKVIITLITKPVALWGGRLCYEQTCPIH